MTKSAQHFGIPPPQGMLEQKIEEVEKEEGEERKYEVEGEAKVVRWRGRERVRY